MPFKDSGKNIMLNEVVSVITHVSLHSAFPATGGNELAGGGYARQAITWDAAAAGSISDATNGATFSIEAGDTVAAVGFNTALTGGTIHADADVTDEVFGGAGTYELTNATLSIT